MAGGKFFDHVPHLRAIKRDERDRAVMRARAPRRPELGLGELASPRLRLIKAGSLAVPMDLHALRARRATRFSHLWHRHARARHTLHYGVTPSLCRRPVLGLRAERAVRPTMTFFSIATISMPWSGKISKDGPNSTNSPEFCRRRSLQGPA
jgi:hypothetical protein